MKRIVWVLCFLFFMQHTFSQVLTTDFVVEYVVSTPSDKLQIWPINDLGVLGAQTGVVYNWTIRSSLDTQKQTGQMCEYLVLGRNRVKLNICMHAYANADSANTVITVCKTYYVDTTLHRDPGYLIRHIFYEDKNENCMRDSGERMVRFHAAYTNEDGEYSCMPRDYYDTVKLHLIKDTYSIRLLHPDVAFGNCNKKEIYSDSVHATMVQLIPIVLTGSGQDIGVYLWQTKGWSPGFTGAINLDIKNNGVFDTNASVQLRFPDSVVYLNSSVPPSSVTTGNVSWDLKLFAQESMQIHVRFRISSAVYNNKDSVLLFLESEPVAGEYDTLDNRMALEIPLSGSFDPNDKTVFGRHPMNTAFPAEYRIHFQNTGNGPAHRVVIRDTLPEQADPASVRILSASHDLETRLEGNRLEFHFEDIMLPDSASEPLKSQGYVRFSVFLRKNGTQTTHDSVANRASIYFDFNEPVPTGYAVLYAAIAPVNNVFAPRNQSNLILFPNPGKRYFELTSKTGALHDFIEVYQTNGSLILRQTIANATERVKVEIPDFIPAGTYFVRTAKGTVLRWVLLP